MDSTTLVTFLFHSPQPAHTVELLGSWDNFTTPYAMERDIRKGSRFWSGCYTFENIVCDGDELRQPNEKRSGALRMGGMYWYYYRLNGDNECHDAARPSTTRCPMLPGQQVNVLEVPNFVAKSVPTSSTAHAAHQHGRSPSIPNLTLDPGAKFVNPRPVPVPCSVPPIPTEARHHATSIRAAPQPSVIGTTASTMSTSHKLESNISTQGPTQPPSTAIHLPSSTPSSLASGRARSKSFSTLSAAAKKHAVDHSTTPPPPRRASESDQASPSQPGAASGKKRSPEPTVRNDISQILKQPTRWTASKPIMDSPSSVCSATFSPLKSHPPTFYDEKAFAEGAIESLKSHAISPIIESTLSNTLAQLSACASRASSCESVIRSPLPASHSQSRGHSPANSASGISHASLPRSSAESVREATPVNRRSPSPSSIMVPSIGPPAPLTFSSVATIPEEPTFVPTNPSNLNKRLPELPRNVPMPRGFAPPADWDITPAGEIGSKFSAWSSDTARSSITLEAMPPVYPGSPTFSSSATDTTLNSPHRLSFFSDYEPALSSTSSVFPSEEGSAQSGLKLPSPAEASDQKRQGICVQSNPFELAYSLPQDEGRDGAGSRTKVRAEMAKLAEILGEDTSSTSSLEEYVNEI